MTPAEIYQALADKFGDVVFDFKEVTPPSPPEQMPDTVPDKPVKMKDQPSYFDPHFFVKPDKVSDVTYQQDP